MQVKLCQVFIITFNVMPKSSTPLLNSESLKLIKQQLLSPGRTEVAGTNGSMKISKNLVLIVLAASLVPAVYFKVDQWISGEVTSIPQLLSGLMYYILIAAVFTISIALIVFLLLLWLQKEYPWHKNVTKRLVIELVLTSALTLTLAFILTEVLKLIIPKQGFAYSIQTYNILETAILMNLILVPISEGVFFFDNWKKSFMEKEKLLLLKEQLEKEHVISQNESLRSQINPHFLFNSLNVLSSLIHEDTDKAEEFIEEFASVYRYVLDLSNKQVVPLKKELDFIHSYFFLQQIRFGDHLKIEMHLNDNNDNFLILPLSLQLLVENAIKHNKISKEHPLTITIEIENDYLVVKNNLQIRNETIVSTGIGLKNIRERYFLYNKSQPIFEKTNDEFIAKIPLIKE
jgi:sensor histidine kinase YesM